MQLAEYIQEIRLELTGNLLEMEIDDATLGQVVNKAFREVQRYIDVTRLITVPYASCIDLKDFKMSSISKIYRTEGYQGDPNSGASLYADPMYAQMWMSFTNGGTMYNVNDWLMNYASWNTLLQIRNTTSTDMAFRQDKQAKKLYVNCIDKPAAITIEYVPIFETIDEITSDYWIDILTKLSVALTKVILGRIRSRYTQTNALWTQDGETLLQEGNEALKDLRETLRVNSQLMYPID